MSAINQNAREKKTVNIMPVTTRSASKAANAGDRTPLTQPPSQIFTSPQDVNSPISATTSNKETLSNLNYTELLNDSLKDLKGHLGSRTFKVWDFEAMRNELMNDKFDLTPFTVDKVAESIWKNKIKLIKDKETFGSMNRYGVGDKGKLRNILRDIAELLLILSYTTSPTYSHFFDTVKCRCNSHITQNLIVIDSGDLSTRDLDARSSSLKLDITSFYLVRAYLLLGRHDTFDMHVLNSFYKSYINRYYLIERASYAPTAELQPDLVHLSQVRDIIY